MGDLAKGVWHALMPAPLLNPLPLMPTPLLNPLPFAGPENKRIKSIR